MTTQGFLGKINVLYLGMRQIFAMLRATVIDGEMAEWSKAHAWKVCIRQ